MGFALGLVNDLRAMLLAGPVERLPAVDLTGDDDPLHLRKVRPRLLFRPRWGARRELLQSEVRRLMVAGVTTRVVRAPLQKNGLNLRSKRLEIEPFRTRERRRGALPLQRRASAQQAQEYSNENECSAHARFIYGGPPGVK